MDQDLQGRLRAARPGWPRLVEYLVLALLAAGLALAIYGPAPGLLRAHDVFRQVEPYHAFARRALLAGRLPEWNPHIGLGRPFLADIETGIFYPPNWLPIALGLRVGLLCEAALHVAVLVLGMVLLARKLGIERRVSIACGFLLASSGPVLANFLSGQIHLAFAACWMPAIWLVGLALVETGSCRAVATLAAVLALQILCGNPQVSWMTCLSLAVLVLVGRLRLPLRVRLRDALRDFLLLGGAGGLAVLLCGAQLVPFATLVSQSVRHASSLALASAYPMNATGWVSWFRPAELDHFQVNYLFYIFTGSAVAIAALAGLVLLRGALVRALLVVSLLFALISAGVHTPVFAILFHMIPGLGWFRIHARANLVMVFALVLVAGLFVSRARRHAGVIAVLGLVTGLGLWIAWPRVGERLEPLLALPLAAALLLLWTWVRTGSLARLQRLMPLALVAMLAIELVDSTLATRRLALRVPDQMIEANLAALLRGQARLPGEVAPPRIAIPYPWVRETAGMIFGWSTFTQHGPLPLARVWNYLHGVLGIPIPEGDDAVPSMDIYRRGVRPYSSTNLRVGFRASPTEAVVIASPDPRAFVATRAVAVENSDEAIARMRDGHDFHRAPLVERNLTVYGSLPTSLFGDQDPSAEFPPGQARIVAFDAEVLEVETFSPNTALLVLGEAWFPGWEALIDGKDTSCFPVNAWMRAMVIPAGAHRVLVHFSTPGLIPGFLLSLAGLLILLFLVRASRGHGTRGALFPIDSFPCQPPSTL